MDPLLGTLRLTRLVLRLDWPRLLTWVAVLAGFPILTAGAFVELYADAASRNGLVATFGANPAYAALLGPIYDSSIGALTAWRIGVIGGVLASLMAILLMIRHTRDEEETGRRELLGATVVGRYAPLAAALLIVIGTGALIGGLVALGLLQLELPQAGALAYGLGVFAIVIVFAAVGSVVAQLTHGGGTARGLGMAILGLAFVLRAAGDASGPEFLGWLSPLGWFTRLRPFAENRWWVLLLSGTLSLVLAMLGFALASRRDIGAGVLSPRAGPERAPTSLNGPFGLAWRLQRASLVGWTAGLAVIAALYGTVANNVDELMSGNPQLAAVLEALGGTEAITATFFAFTAGILALFASAYSVRTALRLRVEEENQRAEPILATATPRAAFMASHLLVAIAGSAVMLGVGGVIMGATYGANVGDVAGQLVSVSATVLGQVPAVWVITGAAAALFGLLPRLTSLAWALLVACLVVGQLGQILRFPQWLLNLSPFTHLTAGSGFLPVAVLLGIALVLLGAGFGGFRARDLATS